MFKTLISKLTTNWQFNALASAVIATLMVIGYQYAKAHISDLKAGAIIFVVVFIGLYLILNNNAQIKAKFDATVKKL